MSATSPYLNRPLRSEAEAMRQLMPCSTCDGGGSVVHEGQDCCGDLHPHGGCRGHCAIQRDERAMCPDCHGAGHMPQVIPTTSDRGA